MLTKENLDNSLLLNELNINENWIKDLGLDDGHPSFTADLNLDRILDDLPHPIKEDPISVSKSANHHPGEPSHSQSASRKISLALSDSDDEFDDSEYELIEMAKKLNTRFERILRRLKEELAHVRAIKFKMQSQLPPTGLNSSKIDTNRE